MCAALKHCRQKEVATMLTNYIHVDGGMSDTFKHAKKGSEDPHQPDILSPSNEPNIKLKISFCKVFKKTYFNLF